MYPCDPAAGYLAIRQMITIDWGAPRCVGWILYSWDTGAVFSLEEHLDTVRDHGESVERFLSAVAVVSLGSFIRVEDARRSL